MTDRLHGPLDQEPLTPLGDDEDLVTGMGGGDDPIVDGVEVETDFEEAPIDRDVPSPS